MSERLNQDNAGEQTVEVTRVSQLLSEVNELRTELDNWKIYFSANIIPNGDKLEIDVVGSLNNGKGVRKTISQDVAAYYANDKNTLTSELSAQIMEALIGKRAYDELYRKLGSAIDNVVKMSGKSSL